MYNSMFIRGCTKRDAATCKRPSVGRDRSRYSLNLKQLLFATTNACSTNVLYHITFYLLTMFTKKETLMFLS